MAWRSLIAELLRSLTAPVHVLADHLDPGEDDGDDGGWVSHLGQPWTRDHLRYALRNAHPN